MESHGRHWTIKLHSGLSGVLRKLVNLKFVHTLVLTITFSPLLWQDRLQPRCVLSHLPCLPSYHSLPILRAQTSGTTHSPGRGLLLGPGPSNTLHSQHGAFSWRFAACETLSWSIERTLASRLVPTAWFKQQLFRSASIAPLTQGFAAAKNYIKELSHVFVRLPFSAVHCTPFLDPAHPSARCSDGGRSIFRLFLQDPRSRQLKTGYPIESHAD